MGDERDLEIDEEQADEVAGGKGVSIPGEPVLKDPGTESEAVVDAVRRRR